MSTKLHAAAEEAARRLTGQRVCRSCNQRRRVETFVPRKGKHICGACAERTDAAEKARRMRMQA